MLARVGAAIVALFAGAAAVVIAALLLRSQPQPSGRAGSAVPAPAGRATASAPAGGRMPTPGAPGFPSPPPGAVVLAREAGTRALGLAIVPGARRSLVRASVLSPAGPGVRGLEVSLAADGRTTALHPCAAGCYQAEVPTTRLGGQVTVLLGRAGYRFELPPTLRLPDATRILVRAARVWRSLETLVWRERLAASPTDVLYTVYRAVAPDELAYTISGGSSAIIIGHRRWDRATPTGAWVRSSQNPPVTQPQPFWAGFADARILASERIGGRRVWVVSFFDPLTPGWFEARIDKVTGRTLRLQMTAVSHFMRHVYGPFDAPFELHPPPA